MYDDGVRQGPVLQLNETKPTAGIFSTYPQHDGISTVQCFADQVCYMTKLSLFNIEETYFEF